MLYIVSNSCIFLNLNYNKYVQYTNNKNTNFEIDKKK